jgi:hypothetical protein
MLSNVDYDEDDPLREIKLVDETFKELYAPLTHSQRQESHYAFIDNSRFNRSDCRIGILDCPARL